MTTAAQVAANQRNALLSTGPRSDAGKATASRNAVKHGLLAASAVAVTRGPFAESVTDVQEFVDAVVDELHPVGPQETAEALAIAGLHVRRRRLLELEAVALAGTTRARLLPAVEPGGPPRVTYEEQERAASRALDSDLFRQLPRYESHLSRELDRCLGRLRSLQALRLSGRVWDA